MNQLNVNNIEQAIIYSSKKAIRYIRNENTKLENPLSEETLKPIKKKRKELRNENENVKQKEWYVCSNQKTHEEED